MSFVSDDTRQNWAELGRIATDWARKAEEREAEERDRAHRERFLTLPFLPTSTAARMFHVIERCISMRRNGLVIGAPGVGKTTVLQEAQRRSDRLEGPEVSVIKIEPEAGGSAMAIMDDLAPILGVRTANSLHATVRRLAREASLRPLVIFDEAQNLKLRVIHQLLSISEGADVRMVFVGNPEALQHVNSQMADVRLVSRRLPYRDTIDGISDDDADQVASYFGVEEMAGFHLCRRLGAVFHMDGIVEVLREARRQAGEAKTLRPPVIEAALDAFPQFQAGLASAKTPALASRQRSAPRRIGA